jgi:hypothetical protein
MPTPTARDQNFAVMAEEEKFGHFRVLQDQGPVYDWQIHLGFKTRAGRTNHQIHLIASDPLY